MKSSQLAVQTASGEHTFFVYGLEPHELFASPATTESIAERRGLGKVASVKIGSVKRHRAAKTAREYRKKKSISRVSLNSQLL